MLKKDALAELFKGKFIRHNSYKHDEFLGMYKGNGLNCEFVKHNLENSTEITMNFNDLYQDGWEVYEPILLNVNGLSKKYINIIDLLDWLFERRVVQKLDGFYTDIFIIITIIKLKQNTNSKDLIEDTFSFTLPRKIHNQEWVKGYLQAQIENNFEKGL